MSYTEQDVENAETEVEPWGVGVEVFLTLPGR